MKWDLKKLYKRISKLKILMLFFLGLIISTGVSPVLGIGVITSSDFGIKCTTAQNYIDSNYPMSDVTVAIIDNGFYKKYGPGPNDYYGWVNNAEFLFDAIYNQQLNVNIESDWVQMRDSPLIEYDAPPNFDNSHGTGMAYFTHKCATSIHFGLIKIGVNPNYPTKGIEPSWRNAFTFAKNNADLVITAQFLDNNQGPLAGSTDQKIVDAFNYGVFVVAAAGNRAHLYQYADWPARHLNVFSIGSSDNSGNEESFVQGNFNWFSSHYIFQGGGLGWDALTPLTSTSWSTARTGAVASFIVAKFGRGFSGGAARSVGIRLMLGTDINNADFVTDPCLSLELDSNCN